VEEFKGFADFQDKFCCNYYNHQFIPCDLMGRKEALAYHDSGYNRQIEVTINVSVLQAIIRLKN